MGPVLGCCLAPLVQALGDLPLVPLSAGFVEATGCPQIILCDMMPREIMGVAVAFAMR